MDFRDVLKNLTCRNYRFSNFTPIIMNLTFKNNITNTSSSNDGQLMLHSNHFGIPRWWPSHNLWPVRTPSWITRATNDTYARYFAPISPTHEYYRHPLLCPQRTLFYKAKAIYLQLSVRCRRCCRGFDHAFSLSPFLQWKHGNHPSRPRAKALRRGAIQPLFDAHIIFRVSTVWRLETTGTCPQHHSGDPSLRRRERREKASSVYTFSSCNLH